MHVIDHNMGDPHTNGVMCTLLSKKILPSLSEKGLGFAYPTRNPNPISRAGNRRDSSHSKAEARHVQLSSSTIANLSFQFLHQQWGFVMSWWGCLGLMDCFGLFILNKMEKKSWAFCVTSWVLVREFCVIMGKQATIRLCMFWSMLWLPMKGFLLGITLCHKIVRIFATHWNPFSCLVHIQSN